MVVSVEPCFWGVGTSPNARKMIADAAKAEKESKIKATDDFFLKKDGEQMLTP